jgi:hypothetical protein
MMYVIYLFMMPLIANFYKSIKMQKNDNVNSAFKRIIIT